MEFVLYYRGDLKANAKPGFKHKLRKYFHTQLSLLWQQEPLSGHRSFLKNHEDLEPHEMNIIKVVGDFIFAPLVCSKLHLVTSLAVTMLRPEPPGKIVTQAGDIDNRLKTLFDSLKMPTEQELPRGEKPEQDESPFFCLLEDDSRITKLVVETDRLLDPLAESSEVVLLLRIRTSKLREIWGNIGL